MECDLLGRWVAKKVNDGSWRWYFYDGLKVIAEGMTTTNKVFYTLAPGPPPSPTLPQVRQRLIELLRQNRAHLRESVKQKDAACYFQISHCGSAFLSSASPALLIRVSPI